MRGMKKVNSILEPILEHVSVKDKVIIEVGCGTGDVTRWLAMRGASITGLDTPAMVRNADHKHHVRNEKYIAAMGQELPFKKGLADIVLFIASLHHIPDEKMGNAMLEAYRILKPGGICLIIEPVHCTYTKLTQLVDDETEVRSKAQTAIVNSENIGFKKVKDSSFYEDRSLEDFSALLDKFCDFTSSEKNAVMKDAISIAQQMIKENGGGLGDYIFQSAANAVSLIK